MRFAVISDIHSNYEPLKRVLAKIKSLKIAKIYCAGDIVGYYDDVNEVFDLVRANKVVCIMGNHDYATLRGVPVKDNDVGRKSLINTKSKITNSNIEFLRKLPLYKTLRFDKISVLIVHGSPWNVLDGYIYPNNLKKIEKMGSFSDLVILGHTHIPMIFINKNSIVLNPGSTGQPRDGNLHASFAIVEIKKTKISVQIIRC